MKLFELAIKSPNKLRKGNNPSFLDVAFTKCPDNVVVLLGLQIRLQESDSTRVHSADFFRKPEDRNEAATIVN